MPTTILHIEDNPENRLLVRTLLPADRFAVVEAEDGLSGIAAALRERPALILLDVGLPKMDGYEVAAALRALPALRETTIVALTAFVTSGDRERILATGCDGYLAKPIDPDAFPGQVAEFLRGRRDRLDREQELPLLRELNQRFVGHLLERLEQVERLTGHFERRSTQLAQLQWIFETITPDLDVGGMLASVLPAIARAIGVAEVRVELDTPFDLVVTGRAGAAGSAPGGENGAPACTIPLVVQQRPIGRMTVRNGADPDVTGDDEQLLKVVASHLASSVENARLYADLRRQVEALQRAQARLVEAARLAAVGELAAAVAHEINNPLTSVLGFASMMAEQVPPDQPLREQLEIVVSEAARARDIVRDLLDFGRQRPLTLRPVDVNGIVSQAVALLRPASGRVTIHEEYDPRLPLVEADASRLKQVFLNIVQNALHAMPGGGHLRVRTERDGEDVTVTFTDTGVGIPPENLTRIFDPFFTTKPDANGTGLGLSVSLGIVRQHGGAIEVESEPDRGATFTVRLPVRRRVTAEEQVAA
ncbi:MAG: response regulator [Candidatus Rokubacteria bacterium]|nr:response regulator [Candidatus Rokubacteria bacterium]